MTRRRRIARSSERRSDHDPARARHPPPDHHPDDPRQHRGARRGGAHPAALWASCRRSNEPELFVHVPFPNATPEQTERLIVRPLEEALGSVKGVKNMWSSCDANGGRVRLDFAWGHEMSLARAEVLERIDRIRRELPDTIGDITIGGNWDAREDDAAGPRGAAVVETRPLRELRPARAQDRPPARADPRRRLGAPRRRQPEGGPDQPPGRGSRGARDRRPRGGTRHLGLQLRSFSRRAAIRRATLQRPHRGHLHERRADPQPAAAAATDCGSPTSPTSSTRSRRSSTAAISTATSPSASP